MGTSLKIAGSESIVAIGQEIEVVEVGSDHRARHASNIAESLLSSAARPKVEYGIHYKDRLSRADA